MAEDENTAKALSPKIVESQSPSKSGRVSLDPAMKKRTQDLIIDLHGVIQKWELLNQKSFQTLNSLVTSRTQLESSKEAYKADASIVSKECWVKYKVKIMKLRESLIQDHKDNVMAMEVLYRKIDKIVVNLGAINLMASEQENPTIMFSTWSVKDFYRGARAIFNCYTKEWLFKQEISNYFLGNDSKEEASKDACFLSMWLQQPYLDDGNEYQLELMLNECGMKSL